MTAISDNPILPYRYRFIGRDEAIDRFFSLRTLRSQKNVLYVEAEGGVGKTRLLEEMIYRCQVLPRPWHVAPEGVAPLIDFYNLQNRTVAGLRRSIVQRLGEEYFEHFLQLDNELQMLQSGLAPETRERSLAAVRQEAEYWFFREFKRAIREAKRYSVLFFDTFEVAYTRRVGRWFLDTFLAHPSTNGCLIVFAGRPVAGLKLPSNAWHYPLKPFSKQETQDYLETKFGEQYTPWLEKIYQRSQGHPLIIDLLTQGASWESGTLEDLLNTSGAEFERRLVRLYTNLTHPQQGFLFEQILILSVLKHRYNRQVFEAFYNSSAETNYNAIEEQLRNMPFVKYRHGEHALTLHDRFQEMVARYAGRDRDDMVQEIYDKIIQKWYAEQIASTAPGPANYLLQTEQLAYMMEYRPEEGWQRYTKLLQSIEENKQFELNDMLWGEVFALLKDNNLRYQAALKQANLLFENSRYEDATFWFETILSPSFTGVAKKAESENQAKVRLGHCYFQQGMLKQADDLWQKSLEIAKEQNDLKLEAIFAFNLAHLRVEEGKWDEARRLYEKAAEVAREAREWETLGQSYYVMARLLARQGKRDDAQRYLRRGLDVMKRKFSEQIQHAQALIYAGDIYRYLSNPLSAQNHYTSAQRILESLEEDSPLWQARAQSGLGAAYTLSSRAKRIEANDLAGAWDNLQRAFTILSNGLTLAREHELNRVLPEILDHLAGAFEELDALEQQIGNNKTISRLWVEGLRNLELPEEQKWLRRLRDSQHRFAELDTLGKAQRLFELAMYEADDNSDYHRMFDALIQAAMVAQMRHRPEDLTYFGMLANTLHGLEDPSQETLFLNFLHLLEALLRFNQDPSSTIQRYAEAAIPVARSGSFGQYLLQRQLPSLRNALFSLPDREQALQLVRELEKRWEDEDWLPDMAFDLEIALG